MTNEKVLKIYVAQSENVRYLFQIIEEIKRDIKVAIRNSKDFQVEVKTKMLALLYSTWSEAQFIQLVYTENGFSISEIKNIVAYKDRYGISKGWEYMIELAFQQFGDISKRTDLQNRKQKIIELIRLHIEKSSILRNKIAHGQWKTAFNSELTDINTELTKEINQLDYIEICKKIEIHKFFGFIVRDLIQSPKKGFHNRYWNHVCDLEQYIERTKGFSLESARVLLVKKSLPPNHISRGVGKPKTV
jgi:DNA-binding transcriptional MerR regulator